MTVKIAFCAAVMLLASNTLAQANDSAAKVSAGGIVLEKTDSVHMRSEDLYVSKDLVKVHYVFENVTDAPQNLTVASRTF